MLKDNLIKEIIVYEIYILKARNGLISSKMILNLLIKVLYDYFDDRFLIISFTLQLLFENLYLIVVNSSFLF